MQVRLIWSNLKLKRKTIKNKHLKCGRITLTTPDSFNQGGRCHYCNQSEGEKLVEDILESNNYNFKEQVSFKDCKNKHPLPFDFGVYNDKNELVALIEYQGIQHYKPIDFFGGEEEFIERQKRDGIKKNYCRDINTPLIEIHCSLTDEEVSDFLLSELESLGLIIR